MINKSSDSSYFERTLIAIILVLVLFLSPLTEFWAALSAPWYSPYLVWCLAILIAFLLQRSIKSDDNR